MRGSKKRKLNLKNNVTSAHKRRICDDEENGRQHADDDRPRFSRWRAARSYKCRPHLYFDGDSGSRDKAKREEIMASATSSNDQMLDGTTAQIALQGVKEIFRLTFSERLSGLEGNYDPEIFTNPLSDEMIEAMRSSIANFLSFEENGHTTVFNEMSKEAKEYIEDTVFSYIDENIDHEQFIRTFARIVKVLQQIRVYINQALDFEFANRWGETVSQNCIKQVYAEYSSQLVSVVLKKMRDIRQVEEIDSHNNVNSLFDIGRYFEDFDDDVWQKPYLESISNDTLLFLESFNLQPPGIELFAQLANTRAEKEMVFTSSFRFDRAIRKQTFMRIYTAFSQKFEIFANDNPQHSLPNLLQTCIQSIPSEQADDEVSRFFKVVNVYGNGDLWSTMRDKLKEKIAERGDTLIQTHGRPTGDWDMESLRQAVQKFSEYEKSVKDVFHLPNTLSGLKSMVINVFDRLFKTMFRRDIRRKLPEEYLVELVEDIAMRTDAEITWQHSCMDHIKAIMPHIQDKDSFLSHIERIRRAHDPVNMERRNRIFLRALDGMRYTTSVSPEVTDSVRRACNPHLNATQAVTTRPEVIHVQYTLKTAQTNSGDLVPSLSEIEIDALMFFIISIPKFCGQRHAVSIRMTRMQMEVFSFMLQYGKCSKDTVRQLVTRIGVFRDAATAGRTADLITDSLKDAGLLAIQQTNDGEMVALGSPNLKEPYMEVGPVHPDIGHTRTEDIFLMDNKIVDLIEHHNVTSTEQLFISLFDLNADSSFEVITERMHRLAARNYISVNDMNLSLVPFTNEEPQAANDV